MKIPLPDGRGEQPTNTLVFGSRVNRRSVGPSAQSNATELLPIGLAGLNARELFSSDDVALPATTAPVPSSYSVAEKVLVAPAKLPGSPTQSTSSTPGTLIQRTWNALMLANPRACTGKVQRLRPREAGFISAHAG